jgi:hypothetical protein
VAVTSKFNKDEAQRRMLIQRLENENQAYSIKLEVSIIYGEIICDFFYSIFFSLY